MRVSLPCTSLGASNVEIWPDNARRDESFLIKLAKVAANAEHYNWIKMRPVNLTARLVCRGIKKMIVPKNEEKIIKTTNLSRLVIELKSVLRFPSKRSFEVELENKKTHIVISVLVGDLQLYFQILSI